VKIPVGFGPERGNSIFAKKDIEAFTVIGPYSGILRRSDEELDIAIRQNGSVNTLTYAFETNSTKRTIDAFQHGNVTSIINTGNLAGHAPWAENNVVALSVGNNLIFYVAPEKILAGTELLLDYGPSYNPYQLVKQEQEDE
jgi:SET domain-containing protein